MSLASRAVNRLRKLYGNVLWANRLAEAERFSCPAALRPRLEAMEPRLLLSTSYLVTSLADDVALNGVITLREAIQAANTNVVVGDAPAGDPAAADIIHFDPSLTGGTITLGGTELAITGSLQIVGLGADRLTVKANNVGRVFNVSAAGAVVSISGLRVTGGNSATGGAVRNTGTLTLSGVVISGNSSTDAAAIYSTGTLTVLDSSVTGNTASAASSGAVVVSGGTAVLLRSLVSGNTGGSGAGILFTSGTLRVIDSTVSGNTATGNGGGLYVSSGTAYVTQSTITANSAARGGGIYRSSGTVTLDNTVVAGNSAPTNRDVEGSFASAGGYNLIGVIDGSSGLNAASAKWGTAAAPLDPMLGPLADNGGPTLTLQRTFGLAVAA